MATIQEIDQKIDARDTADIQANALQYLQKYRQYAENLKKLQAKQAQYIGETIQNRNNELKELKTLQEDLTTFIINNENLYRKLEICVVLIAFLAIALLISIIL